MKYTIISSDYGNTEYSLFNNGNARIEVERCGQVMPLGTKVYFKSREKGKMETGEWIGENQNTGTIFIKARKKEYHFQFDGLFIEKGLPLGEAVDQCVIKDFKEGKI